MGCLVVCVAGGQRRDQTLAAAEGQRRALGQNGERESERPVEAVPVNGQRQSQNRAGKEGPESGVEQFEDEQCAVHLFRIAARKPGTAQAQFMVEARLWPRYNRAMFMRKWMGRWVGGLGLVLVVVLALAMPGLGRAQESEHRGRKYKPPPETARITVTVRRAVDGKPVSNAAVIFHATTIERDKGNMELKTNEDGVAQIDVLPIGATARLQVIARGYQTYGAEFPVDRQAFAMEVKLVRPVEQYSIYKEHPQQERSAPAGERRESQPR